LPSLTRLDTVAVGSLVEIGAPDGSVTLNEASGGTTTDPPGWSVNGVATEIRFRFLPLDASVKEINVQSGAWVVEVTTAVGWVRLIELTFAWRNTGTSQGGATRLLSPFRFTMP
jgi:hypothetical protein